MDLKTKRRAQRGFTLIEMMLVVVIIGIISSIAIPYYTRASARAYRSEAMMTISKIELYFKNIYENQGSYVGPSVKASGVSSDVMPDPTGTVPVGQGADWKPAAGGGWEDLPFPPQGDIRMRYRYKVDNSTTPPQVTLEACGSFPGFGAPSIAFGAGGAKCNYVYTEIMQGTSIDPVQGVAENPINSFE
jgi:prepilin-type N-terminal cleavage/methylation domain-containing protein